MGDLEIQDRPYFFAWIRAHQHLFSHAHITNAKAFRITAHRAPIISTAPLFSSAEKKGEKPIFVLSMAKKNQRTRNFAGALFGYLFANNSLQMLGFIEFPQGAKRYQPLLLRSGSSGAGYGYRRGYNPRNLCIPARRASPASYARSGSKLSARGRSR